MSKIRFSISIKIHQNTQKVHSKSKHPVTITIKNSIQIHQSFFGGKKLDGSGLTSKAPCQSFADFLKDLALVRRQMQDVPWQNMCWDGLVTYRGEVSHQSSVCVCVFFFGGDTSLHRFIFHWKCVQRCCQTVLWIPSGCKGDLKLSVNLGGMLG